MYRNRLGFASSSIVAIFCLVLLLSCAQRFDPLAPNAPQHFKQIHGEEVEVFAARILKKARHLLPSSARVLVPDFEARVVNHSESWDLPLKQQRMAADSMRDGLEAGLVGAGIVVVNRTGLQNAQDEILLSHSGLMDDFKTVRLGKMLGATHMFMGRMDIVITDELHMNTLTVRLIDIETMTTLDVATLNLDTPLHKP